MGRALGEANEIKMHQVHQLIDLHSAVANLAAMVVVVGAGVCLAVVTATVALVALVALVVAAAAVVVVLACRKGCPIQGEWQ